MNNPGETLNYLSFIITLQQKVHQTKIRSWDVHKSLDTCYVTRSVIMYEDILFNSYLGQ